MISQAKNTAEIGFDESMLEGDPRWEAAVRASRSSALSRATHLRGILLYAVRHAIREPEQPLPEFEIAYHVLGRRSDFNPLDDNIVRVQVGHLRKKLDQYFSTEGQNEEVLIAIPLGSYKPIFSSRSETGVTIQPKPRTPNRESQEIDDAGGASRVETRLAVPGFPGTARQTRWMLRALMACGLVIGALCVALLTQFNRDRALYRSLYAWKSQPAVAAFWSEFLDSRPATDVVMADSSFSLVQIVSKKSFSLQDYFSHGYLNQLQARDVSPEMRDALNMIASKNLGNSSDFRLARRIEALDPAGKTVHLYSAREYMPALITQDNVILIGSPIANPWDELFENQMNFTAKSGGSTPTYIANRAPTSGEQSSYVPSGSVGYCTVAYLPNGNHTANVLLVEGTGSEATEAAGDFLLSEDQLSDFQKRLHVTRLPYFEVLLKASQVKGTPLSTTLVAYRTYPKLR